MASARFTPWALSPGTQGVFTFVVRYRADAPAGAAKLEPMLGIRWTEIRWARGAAPPTCSLRYAYLPDDPYPVPFELALPQNPVYPIRFDNDHDDIDPLIPADLLKLGDRIGVVGITPRGRLRWLFDGFVTTPEAHVSGRQYHVPLQAVGTPIREFDLPLKGSLWRDAFLPGDPEANVETALPARFNPDGRANAAGDPQEDGSWDAVLEEEGVPEEDQFHFPIFLDPLAVENDPARVAGWVRRWDLGMAARYVLARGNADQEFVKRPHWGAINNALSALVPKSGGAIDPEDDRTFARVPILAPDRTVSDQPYPLALWNLIEPFGFAFTWVLESDQNDLPTWRLKFLRERDNLGTITKTIGLQPAGETIDPGRSMVRGFALARDAARVVNAYSVTTRPDRIEVGMVLVPGFRVEASDADEANKPRWKTDYTGSDGDLQKFRLWIADEAGEGHWDYGAGGLGDWVADAPISLDAAFGEGNWVVRRRPGRRALVTTDANGEPLRGGVSLLFGYEGGAGLWDGTGTVAPGKLGFEALSDRLGVRLTCGDPANVQLTPGDGNPNGPGNYLSGGVINLVDWLTDASRIADPLQRPYLLLTCTIEADQAIEAVTGRRVSCPLDYTVRRYVDGRDRFARERVHRSSRYFDKSQADAKFPDFITKRDDSRKALEYAEGLRSATEMPVVGGALEVGRLVNAYQLGDRLAGIAGRKLSLESNVNAEAGEKPRYPAVVGVTWTNEGNAQRTVVQIDDLRGEGGEG